MFGIFKENVSVIAIVITVIGWFAVPFISTFVLSVVDKKKKRQST